MVLFWWLVSTVWRPNCVESSPCTLLPERSNFQWNWLFPSTSIPFRKCWGSSDDDSVTGNEDVHQLMKVPEAVRRVSCLCLLKRCTYPPVTQTWDWELQDNQIQILHPVLTRAEFEVRHGESFNRTLNPLTVLNYELHIYWNVKVLHL